MIGLAQRGIRAVLLDIEGTTTPIAFVHEVLFGFARAHLHAFVVKHRHTSEMADVERRLRAEHAADVARGEAPPFFTDAAAALEAYVLWLMDRDRKSPGLKLLQGQIWEEGYRSGALRGQVFDDVPGAIRRWHGAGAAVAIYSSGSEPAQRRLFESIDQGDLTPYIAAFFDTAVGAKVESKSYERIAAALDLRPHEILFVSDIVRELDAARAAGMPVVLSLRPGNPPQAAAGLETVRNLDEIG